MPELLTADELAARLKISPHTVKRWSKAGKIPTVWPSPKVRRFDLPDVLAALKERTDRNGGGR